MEVSTALGSVSLAEEGRRLVAELGRTSRLSVRWRDSLPGSTIRTTLDADQLLWLKAAPGGVTLDARWKFKVVEGGVRRLQLALDPRLQLQAPLESRNPRPVLRPRYPAVTRCSSSGAGAKPGSRNSR